MAKLSKFQAIVMGSVYSQLRQAASFETREALRRDFESRAQILKDTLERNGYEILPDGLNIKKRK